MRMQMNRMPQQRRKGRHLLKLEDVLVEIVVQVFIGIIDAKLLKAVAGEILKAKNIQDPNGIGLQQKMHALSICIAMNL
jgi:hypothetical protein